MTRRAVIMLGFAAGVVVGKNWPKIKENAKPCLENAVRLTSLGYSKAVSFLKAQNRQLQNLIAKSKKSRRAKKTTAKKLTVGIAKV